MNICIANFYIKNVRQANVLGGALGSDFIYPLGANGQSITVPFFGIRHVGKTTLMVAASEACLPAGKNWNLSAEGSIRCNGFLFVIRIGAPSLL